MPDGVRFFLIYQFDCTVFSFFQYSLIDKRQPKG